MRWTCKGPNGRNSRKSFRHNAGWVHCCSFFSFFLFLQNGFGFRLHFEWNSFYVFTLFTVVSFCACSSFFESPHCADETLWDTHSQMHTWNLLFLCTHSLTLFTFWYCMYFEEAKAKTKKRYEFDDNKHKNAIKRYTFITSLALALHCTITFLDDVKFVVAFNLIELCLCFADFFFLNSNLWVCNAKIFQCFKWRKGEEMQENCL